MKPWKRAPAAMQVPRMVRRACLPVQVSLRQRRLSLCGGGDSGRKNGEAFEPLARLTFHLQTRDDDEDERDDSCVMSPIIGRSQPSVSVRAVRRTPRIATWRDRSRKVTAWRGRSRDVLVGGSLFRARRSPAPVAVDSNQALDLLQNSAEACTVAECSSPIFAQRGKLDSQPQER